jgi:hypothetical protein
MATNEVYVGTQQVQSLELEVAEGIVSGDLVVFPSGLVGVAEIDAWAGPDGVFRSTISTVGVYGFAYTGAVAANTAVYASSTASGGLGVKGTLATTATGNTRVGSTYGTKGAGAGTLRIRIFN